MSTYREQGLQAKAVRVGIVDARPAAGKNRRPRPVIVQSRFNPKQLADKPWSKKWGSYRNLAEAKAAMDQAQRKHPWIEYRIKP